MSSRPSSLRNLALAAVLLSCLGMFPAARVQAEPASQPLLYQDNFDDGNYTATSGANGLTWQVVRGGATVEKINGSQALGAQRNNSLIVTKQTVSDSEYTVVFDAAVTWMDAGKVIVLYKNPNNYYAVGFGKEPGIYRMLNGTQTQFADDPESLVELPNGSNVPGHFKIYAHATAASIEIKVDHFGDGVDYDLAATDTTAAALGMFTGATAIGLMTPEVDTYVTPWIHIDNVAVYQGFVSDPYTPVTYYVDRGNAVASDSNPGSAAQPWKTIQKAANSIRAGDTVIVKPGTYPERIAFENGRRGAPGQVVTFKAEPRRQATLWGFYTQFAHYLRIEGFNIVSDPSLTGWTEQNGVFISSDHVEVVDNNFDKIKSAAISGDSVGAIVQNNRIYQSQMGIVISGSGWLVEGNEVDRLYHWSDGDSDYSRFFGDDHVIRGNYFHGTKFSNPNEIGSAHVDCFQTFDNNGEHGHNILFENNYCSDFHQGLMGEASYHRNISGLTFRNNIFKHGLAWGLCVGQITDISVYHNLFYDIQYHGAGFSDGATAVVRDNIFYDAGSNYWEGDGGTVTGSRNLLYNSVRKLDAADFPDDLVNQDPRFANAAALDFHLLPGSPAIDAGTYSGVPADRDGISRPQGGAEDIGPYEYLTPLYLSGMGRDGTIHLDWRVNFTLPDSAAFTVEYSGGPGTPATPVTGIPRDARSYDLVGLTNRTPYTITLKITGDATPDTSNTIVVTPWEFQHFMPIVGK